MTTWAMIDLETLDTTPKAQILTIGGVKFDPFTWNEPFHEFYYRFDIDEQDKLGRTVSDNTLNQFWAKQPPKVIDEAFSPDGRTDCKTILKALRKWYVGCDRIWSQGEFDIVIIEDLYRSFDEHPPWPFWAVENCRTILNRMEVDPRKEYKFTAHNALEDSKAQVYALRKAFRHFNMKK